jgi:hypothetical protein
MIATTFFFCSFFSSFLVLHPPSLSLRYTICPPLSRVHGPFLVVVLWGMGRVGAKGDARRHTCVRALRACMVVAHTDLFGAGCLINQSIQSINRINDEGGSGCLTCSAWMDGRTK